MFSNVEVNVEKKKIWNKILNRWYIKVMVKSIVDYTERTKDIGLKGFYVPKFNSTVPADKLR